MDSEEEERKQKAAVRELEAQRKEDAANKPKRLDIDAKWEAKQKGKSGYGIDVANDPALKQMSAGA